MEEQKLPEAVKVRNEIADLIGQAANKLRGMYELAQGPQVTFFNVYAFEAQRKMEEVLHRVNDCTTVLMGVSSEDVEDAAQRAAQSPDGKAPILPFPGQGGN